VLSLLAPRSCPAGVGAHVVFFPSSWVRFAIVKPYDFFAIVGVFALQGFGDRLCSCSDHLKPVV